MIGEVYFIQAENGPIKIGFSTDVPRRVGQLQAGMREIMTVLAVMPGDRRTEFYFHRQLRRHRLVGEWFAPDPEVLAAAHGAAEVGLLSVPPLFRPAPEYEVAGEVEDESAVVCRDYCVIIAGHRLGSEKIGDLIARVARLSGLSRREIKAIWYREVRSVGASTFLRLQEIAEARLAVEACSVPLRDPVDSGIRVAALREAARAAGGEENHADAPHRPLVKGGR